MNRPNNNNVLLRRPDNLEQYRSFIVQRLAAGQPVDTHAVDRSLLNGLRADELADGVFWCEAGVGAASAQNGAFAISRSLGPLPLPWLRMDLAAWLAGPWIPAVARVFGAGELPIVDLRTVLADGRALEPKRRPRSAAGPDPRALIFGRGEQLAVLLEASLRAQHETQRLYYGRRFETWHEAVQAARLLQRLNDPALVACAVLPDGTPDSWAIPQAATAPTLVCAMRRNESVTEQPLFEEMERLCHATTPADNVASQWYHERHGAQARDPFAPSNERVRLALLLPWNCLTEFVDQQINRLQGAERIQYAIDSATPWGAVLTVVLNGRLSRTYQEQLIGDLDRLGGAIGDVHGRLPSSHSRADAILLALKACYDPAGLLNPANKESA